MKALVWPVATHGCESWTLRKNEETSLDAFEMKGLRRMLRVSWTAKKTNERIRNKAGVKKELLDTVKARKLAYYGHTMRKQGSCLEKEIMQGTMPGARRRGRPRTAWRTTSRRGQDSPWKSQSERQRTRINGESTSMVWPTLGSRTAEEQNRIMHLNTVLSDMLLLCMLLLSQYHNLSTTVVKSCWENILYTNESRVLYKNLSSFLWLEWDITPTVWIW